MLRLNHAFKTTLNPRDSRDFLYILTDFWGQMTILWSTSIILRYDPKTSRDRYCSFNEIFKNDLWLDHGPKSLI